jgi:PPK2 family polyphosphate:nucleotide phosphotransferase
MKRYLVRPGERVRLARWNPRDSSGFRGVKDDGRKELGRLNVRLEKLQELLFAEHRHPVLIVLQGMDSAGKDGTIRRVFAGVNPQGVRVASFKRPTAPELDHDFLWRIHAELPSRGEMVLFNRSHYEDVLITRVHGTISKDVWERRYREINEFERTLTEEGTVILKFFLHVSRREQKRRLQERLDDPTKHWKFREADLLERERWSAYARAYEDALTATSTRWAPWCVVPSDRKWFRDLVVSDRIVSELERLRMKYPRLPSEWRSKRIP